MVEMEKGTKCGAKMMSAMQLKSGFKELKQNTSNISSDLETLRDTKDVLEEVRGTISSVLSKRRAQESCHKGRICMMRRHHVTKHKKGSTMEEGRGESSIPAMACHGRDPIMLMRIHNENVTRLGGSSDDVEILVTVSEVADSKETLRRFAG
nr:hypothetical protein [Tanacetum cinerariifolium]